MSGIEGGAVASAICYVTCVCALLWMNEGYVNGIFSGQICRDDHSALSGLDRACLDPAPYSGCDICGALDHVAGPLTLF